MAVVGVGVVLTAGCGGSDSSSEPAVTTTPATVPTVYRLGQDVDNGGIVVNVQQIRTESAIEARDAGGGYVDRAAPDGQKFVVLDSRVTNHTPSGIDVSCGTTIGNRFVDAQNRQFDVIAGLDTVQGNRACGDAVPPGSDGQVQWVFAVPADSVPKAFGFYNTATQQPADVKVVDLSAS